MRRQQLFVKGQREERQYPADDQEVQAKNHGKREEQSALSRSNVPGPQLIWQKQIIARPPPSNQSGDKYSSATHRLTGGMNLPAFAQLLRN